MPASSTVAALKEPTAKVNWVFLVSITLANIGILIVLITPLNNLLQRYTDASTGGPGKEAALAWVSGLGQWPPWFSTRWPERSRTGPCRDSVAAGRGSLRVL